jgi:DNA-binding GntR family transcriptional regulator
MAIATPGADVADNTDADDPTKYKRLTVEIRVWLDCGIFQPGEAVPSITELAADRGWSRQTCARALQTLAEEGRLKFYPGLGYHVSGASQESGTAGQTEIKGT